MADENVTVESPNAQEGTMTTATEPQTAAPRTNRGGRPKNQAPASSVQPANNNRVENGKTTWTLAEVAEIRAEYEEREANLKEQISNQGQTITMLKEIAGDFLLLQRSVAKLGIDLT